MPDDEQQNIDASALKSVVSIIKDMELNVSIKENEIKSGKIGAKMNYEFISGFRCSRTDKHQNTLIRKCEIRVIYFSFFAPLTHTSRSVTDFSQVDYTDNKNIVLYIFVP